MSFTADVDRWVLATEQRMEKVFKASAQEVISQAQTTRAEGGNLRVDTGFLRASGQASTETMPQIDFKARPSVGGSYAYSASPIALIIASADLGQTIYFGYTASYAGYREMQDGFVRLAAQNWQQIVERVTEEAKRRAAQ